MYEALRAFHSMEQQQSQAANVVMSEMMNWLLKRIEANSEFLGMFGHIVPQPMREAPTQAMAQPQVQQGPPPMPGPYGNGHAPGGPFDQAEDRYEDPEFDARLAEFRARYQSGNGSGS
jgi:hypothetical protein